MKENEFKKLPNFKHLYYFWTVAKVGHLTRVANQLNVSQSALSFQIKKLEEDLGLKLFERVGRRLLLTEAGRVTFDYANNIFAIGSEMMSSLISVDGYGMQKITVGNVATLSRNFLDRFLRPLLDSEDVQLRVVSGSFDELLDKLKKHQLDLVLSNRQASGEIWRSRRISKQQVCLVGPPRKKRKEFSFPQDINSMKILLPGYSSDIRTAFDLYCEDKNIKINAYAEIDDMALLRLLARSSNCLTLTPEVVVHDELKSGILEKYCNVPTVYENFYAISTERQYQPKILKKILSNKHIIVD